MKKEITITLIMVGLLVILAVIYFYPMQRSSNIIVNNFADCALNGGKIMESSPRQCTWEGDIVYIEEIDGRRYISQDPKQCEVIRFVCETDREPFFDETGCGCKIVTLEDYFVNNIWEKAVDNLGGNMPIEGFNPELYKGAFPLLEDYDFHNTEAYGGTWQYQNDRLIFVRNTDDISTADGTLTNEGLVTLYNNLKIRMDFKLESKEDIDNFLDFLSGEESEPQRVYCTPDQRNVEACTMDYNPVCGWSDPETIQCIRYPCASTYSNACGACAKEQVLFYTPGECPLS